MSPQDGDGMGGWQAEWEREEKRLRDEWKATQQVESPDAVQQDPAQRSLEEQRNAAKLEDFIKDQKVKFFKELENKTPEQAPADGSSTVDEEKQTASQRADQSVSQDKDLQAQAPLKEQLGSIDEPPTSQEQQASKQRDYSAMRLQQAEVITSNDSKDERNDERQQEKTDGEGKSAAHKLDREAWEKGRLEELKDTIATWNKQALQQEINRDWSPANRPKDAPREVRTHEKQEEDARGRVNRQVRDLLNDEFAKKQATIDQDETKKPQQQGLEDGKSSEKNVAETEQAGQRDPIPTRMLHNQSPPDYSLLNETERQLAAQLAARQRDENFVETAREITERKIGNPLDGGGLEKSEEKQPVEAMQDQASKGQVEEKQAKAEPDHLPDNKAYHEQMEKLSIDADTMDVALQERERQQHEKALLEAEVRRGMETADQNAVEEPQPATKTEIQFTSMESLAFDQKRNEEIIQDRESQEREKALEEIKRRLALEAELRKELNKKKGLGLGD